jgi:hypothetical protein
MASPVAAHRGGRQDRQDGVPTGVVVVACNPGLAVAAPAAVLAERARGAVRPSEDAAAGQAKDAAAAADVRQHQQHRLAPQAAPAQVC